VNKAVRKHTQREKAILQKEREIEKTVWGEWRQWGMWVMMARVGVLWQNKMANARQLTFYVSIFTFCVILSGKATTAFERGDSGRGQSIEAIITHSSRQLKPFLPDPQATKQ